MWIDEVTAHSFAAVEDQTLRLRKGLNIVSGRNGTGKSTWHAAVYAALFGQPPLAHRTEADRQFARQWGPVGDDWLVEGVVSDGAGRHRYSQDLHRGRMVEVVGLDRYSYAATAWVEQEDTKSILATAEGGNALQRAVAVCLRYDQVQAALERIAERQRYVGAERVDGRLHQARLAYEAALVRHRTFVERQDHEAHRLTALQDTGAGLASAERRLRAIRARDARNHFHALETNITQALEPPIATWEPAPPVTPWAVPAPAVAGPETAVAADVLDAEREFGAAQAALAAAEEDARAGEAAALAAEAEARVEERRLVAEAAAAAAAAEPLPPDAPEPVWRERVTERLTEAWSQAEGPVIALVIGGLMTVVGIIIALLGSATAGLFIAILGLLVVVIGIAQRLAAPTLPAHVLTLIANAEAARLAAAVVPAPVVVPRPWRAKVPACDLEPQRLRVTVARDDLRAALSRHGYPGSSIEAELGQYRADCDRHAREAVAAAEAAARDAAAAAERATIAAAEQAAQDQARLDDLYAQRADAQRRLHEAATGLQPHEIGAATGSEEEASQAVLRAEAAHRHAEADAERARQLLAEALTDGPTEATLAAAERRKVRLEALLEVLNETAECLGRAKITAFREAARGINDRLDEDMKAITDNDNVTVHVDKDLNIVVAEAGQRGRGRGAGSNSTLRLAYLFTRVALGRHLARDRHLPSPPLLLDDISSNADADRLQRVLDHLLDIARNRQVVVFAHDELTLLWARRQRARGQRVHLVHLTDVGDAPREEDDLAAADLVAGRPEPAALPDTARPAGEIGDRPHAA